MPRTHFVVSGMVLLAAGFAPGQTAPDRAQQPSHGARDADSRSATSGKSDPRSYQTAEDLLRALQADRPVNEVIVPASRSVKRLGDDAHLLLPEGTALIEKSGRLVRQGGGWDFQPDEGKSISILPNAALEDMVTMQKEDHEMKFVVSGEVTVFGNQNLLLTKAATRGTAGEASTTVNKNESPPTLSADAAAEDVLAALQTQRPIGSAGLESGGSAAGRSPSTAAGAALDGSLVVRRSGRLVRNGGSWTFEFDDKRAVGQANIALLPNQSLEIMVQSAERGPTGLSFIVSGEITQFGGMNYLLVRGVTRVLDLGNLRP